MNRLDLIKTDYTIFFPNGLEEEHTIDWPLKPDYPTIRDLLEPIVGGPLEHVSVLRPDFKGATAQAIRPSDARDMFVNEIAYVQAERPPVNRKATVIYLRLAFIRGHKDYYHEILGPAVLFGRRIWF